MKSKKTNPFVITTLIFFMTTVMFGLLTTGVIIKYRKSTVATNTDKLSNDEIEKLKSEEKEDLLSDMKLRFTNGEGSLSILKSYFPDNIVYVSNRISMYLRRYFLNLRRIIIRMRISSRMIKELLHTMKTVKLQHIWVLMPRSFRGILTLRN